MPTGIVKWFNYSKGYGFVSPDQGGKDVFVHITAVEKAGINSVDEGLRVSYQLATKNGRTSAADLKVIGAGGSASSDDGDSDEE